MIQLSDTWLGTEGALAYVLEVMERYREHPEMYPPRQMRGTEQGEESNPLIQVEDGIGILNVSGPLTSQESWLDDYFGLTSYPALSRSMLELADLRQAGEIDQIVHVFSTPGGDANGINGVTEVMRGALDMAPDTVSYTGSHALSAGYWLATVNPKLYMDKMGEVGSIGVISTIMSMARRMEEDGIDVKVVRSGKFKALLHPYEPISEAGVKEVEAKGAQFRGFFLDHVKAHRPGLLTPTLEWGEGQTFFGADAVRLGLADGPLTTLNGLVKNLKTRHNSGRKQIFDYASSPAPVKAQATQPIRGPEMTKKVLFADAADQAAVAAGADLSAVPHQEVDEPDVPVVPEAAVTETVVELAAAPVAAPVESDLVAFLKSELHEARAELDQLKLKLANAEAARDQMASAEEALAPIAREAIQRMQVGMRQTPMSLAGLSASVLAAQYASVKKEFERVMPVGMHAKSGHDDSREPQDVGEQRLFLVK